MRLVDWVLFFMQAVQPHSADAIQCKVTHDGGRTIYSVPHFKATNCHYWWINSSDHVLATHKNDTVEPVLKKNSTSLEISECSELIRYRRDCISETIQLGANCTTKCSVHLEDKGSAGTTRNHWSLLAPGLLAVVVVVFYNLRNHICSCRKCRGRQDSLA